MAKYNSKSVYGTLFTMIDDFSEEDKDYLMDKVFTEKFLNDVKDNPKSAWSTLNRVVQNIENGKTDKVSELLSDYKDKIYMMKNMLKDYGNFEETRLKESMTANTLNSLISKKFGLQKMKKEKIYTRYSGNSNVAYKLDSEIIHKDGDFWCEKYYGIMFYVHLISDEAKELTLDIAEYLTEIGGEITPSTMDDLERTDNFNVYKEFIISVNFKDKPIKERCCKENSTNPVLIKCVFELNKEYKKHYVVTLLHDDFGDFIKFTCKKDDDYDFVVDIWDKYNEIGLSIEDNTLGRREIESDYSDILEQIKDMIRLYRSNILYESIDDFIEDDEEN